jgi:hypothetical protein
MAIFQGVRLRGITLPGESPVRARARARGHGVADPRRAAEARPSPDAARPAGVRPVGILIAMILVATMVGLAYLSQTLGTNATTEEISSLTGRANMARQVLSRQALVVEFAIDPQKVATEAGKLRLRSLGDPVVFRAP